MEDFNELIEKAKHGDSYSFTQLILLIKNDLYKIAKMRLKSEDDIQDVIQETMLQAFKNIKKIRDNSKFKFWIIKILINNCNKVYKDGKNIQQGLEEYNEELHPISTNSSKVEDTLNFYDMIKNLSYEEKIIIILYYNEGYTTKEIGKTLKMKENTVKSKLLRAKLKIKEVYKGGIYE